MTTLKRSRIQIAGIFELSTEFGGDVIKTVITTKTLNKSKTGIYQILNLVNGKYYIGRTTNLERRRNQHFNHLSNGDHISPEFQEDYLKYGENAFEFSVIVYCRPSELPFYEVLLINNLHPVYNQKKEK